MGIKDKLKRTSRYFVNEPKVSDTKDAEPVATEDVAEATESEAVAASDDKAATAEIAEAGETSQIATGETEPTVVSVEQQEALPEVNVSGVDLGDAVESAANVETTEEKVVVAEAQPAAVVETVEETTVVEVKDSDAPATDKSDAAAAAAPAGAEKTAGQKEKKNDFLKKLLNKLRKPTRSSGDAN